MNQLSTLIWLKWTLFRNSLRSSKAVVNRIATILGMLAALLLALLISIGLGIGAYALTAPEVGFEVFRAADAERAAEIPSAEFIFFSVFALCYMFWAILPLSMGSSRQFDPGQLLLYPISLKRLFGIDFVSEVAGLQAVFAIPGIMAIGVGAGLGAGNLPRALLISILAIFFGLALSKFLSTSLGSLLRQKRTRGETLLALIGVSLGLGGALFGQIAPVLFRHAGSISGLRWTPPGAVAYSLTHGLGQGAADLRNFALALFALAVYAVVLVGLTFWLARRTILGGGKAGRKRHVTVGPSQTEVYTGWDLPLLSPALSGVVEKELRYVWRNAQVRMMAVMPLILIAIRLINRRHLDPQALGGSDLAHDFFTYGHGLIATSGVLYVFLILSGLFCNQFAFEQAGMRTLILSPLSRKNVLIGKNLVTTLVALILSAVLLGINHVLFRDLTGKALLFAGFSFLIFAAMLSTMGNWFSVRFPKPMKFGKRFNVSGVVGVLLIPMIGLLALPPLASVAAGFVAESLLVEYVTLAILAALSIGFYLMMIGSQGESLQQRELEVLEIVKGTDGD